MENSRLLRLINKSIKSFQLDLKGLNVLLPSFSKNSMLSPILASKAGAKKVYVLSKNPEDKSKFLSMTEKFKIDSEIIFVNSETPEVLDDIDIVVKDHFTVVNPAYFSYLKEDCIISLLPKNLDFVMAKKAFLENIKEEDLKISVLDFCISEMDICKHMVHLVLKKFYEVGIDVYKSNVLLIGQGILQENILALLNAVGVHVYFADIKKSDNANYIYKHLPDADMIIVADYPVGSTSVIGRDGLIEIDDLTDINPDVTVLNIAGKVDRHALEFANINYLPKNITQNSLNISIDELGLKANVEILAAVLKAAGELIKVNTCIR